MEFIELDRNYFINAACIIEFKYLPAGKPGAFDVLEGTPSSIIVTLSKGEKIEKFGEEADALCTTLLGRIPAQKEDTNIDPRTGKRIRPKVIR